MAADQKERTEFLWNVHSYTNEYIRFADTKAQVIIGSSTLVIGALISANFYRVFTFCRVFGLFLLAASIMASAIAMRPRLRSIQLKGYIYWESIRANRDSKAFVEAFSKLRPEEMTEHLATHLYDLAGIARTKFWWVNLSVWFALFGGALSALIFIWQE